MSTLYFILIIVGSKSKPLILARRVFKIGSLKTKQLYIPPNEATKSAMAVERAGDMLQSINFVTPIIAVGKPAASMLKLKSRSLIILVLKATLPI